MLSTILIGTCVYVQGDFVQKLANGRVRIRVGERLFDGLPV